MDSVNRTIVDRMHSPVEMIPQLASYIVSSGGKRLRPLLTLATARLLGYGGDAHVGLAATVEFIHTATLLHDDVVDESALRRGQASANELFGNQASVLVGDFLFARAFELMVEGESLDILRILSRASAVIAEGEVLQLSAQHDVATTESTYMQVIESKTAQLFAAACEVGAVIAGADETARDNLRRYGLSLGLAFQLVDDVLDYSAEQARLGKRVGDDFAEGKVTLPVILAFEAGDETEKAFWRRTMQDQDIRDGDLAHAQMLLGRHGTLDAAMARAGTIATEAVGLLEAAPDGPIRDALAGVLTFVVDRDY
ncbi:polyprenyl synthetase family protein [Fodinicurvata sp. EGI_FJ10296]|uniref:polyprenyl synthetase family protein n=1 Tax=Fodinicurvata sp. EGI_FJ10296 TaxID=3231908 RepID=UPI0034513080